jgi:trehalose-phosphatase
MVEDSEVDTVIRTVESATARDRDIFRLTAGKKVCEIRPRVDWDKGAAVQWIIGRLGYDSYTPICLGDDETDEDAFAAIPDGLLIRVGKSQKTVAQYYVDSPLEVHKFLLWIADMV